MHKHIFVVACKFIYYSHKKGGFIVFIVGDEVTTNTKAIDKSIPDNGWNKWILKRLQLPNCGRTISFQRVKLSRQLSVKQLKQERQWIRRPWRARDNRNIFRVLYKSSKVDIQRHSIAHNGRQRVLMKINQLCKKAISKELGSTCRSLATGFIIVHVFQTWVFIKGMHTFGWSFAQT